MITTISSATSFSRTTRMKSNKRKPNTKTGKKPERISNKNDNELIVSALKHKFIRDTVCDSADKIRDTVNHNGPRHKRHRSRCA